MKAKKAACRAAAIALAAAIAAGIVATRDDRPAPSPAGQLGR